MNNLCFIVYVALRKMPNMHRQPKHNRTMKLLFDLHQSVATQTKTACPLFMPQFSSFLFFFKQLNEHFVFFCLSHFSLFIKVKWCVLLNTHSTGKFYYVDQCFLAKKLSHRHALYHARIAVSVVFIFGVAVCFQYKYIQFINLWPLMW